jgi:hypothetical protein
LTLTPDKSWIHRWSTCFIAGFDFCAEGCPSRFSVKLSWSGPVGSRRILQSNFEPVPAAKNNLQ